MEPANDIEPVLIVFYEIISGQKTESRNWDKLRSLFHPGACLFPNSVTVNPVNSCGIDIDTYIQNLDRFLGQNDFFEQGSITQVVIQENIASLIGTYEARHTKSDQEPFIHGVNFVHLIHTGSEWKITSMIWRNL